MAKTLLGSMQPASKIVAFTDGELAVLRAMDNGADQSFPPIHSGKRWELRRGSRVKADVAQALIRKGAIREAGFHASGQTDYYITDKGREAARSK